MKAAYPGSAIISECGKYRTELVRVLHPVPERHTEGPTSPIPTLLACGMNPSTAAGDVDDRTIRKLCMYARVWGYARLVMINAYDYRATRPKDLFAARRAGVDVIGPDNASTRRKWVEGVRYSDNYMILAMFGTWVEPARMEMLGEELGPTIHCMGTNQNGSPVHPLYQPNEATPVPWRPTGWSA